MRIIVYISLLLLSASLIAQDDIPIPPKKQNTFYFSIEKFNRQPHPPAYIQERIEMFSSKPKSKWSQTDSLFYAYEKVHLEEFAFALSIFVKLDMDTVSEPHAVQLYRTSLLQTKRYEDLLELNERSMNDDSSAFYSVKDIVQQLTNYYLEKYEATDQEKKKIDTIFPFLYSDTMDVLKSSRNTFKTVMVNLSENIDTALRYFTFLNDSRDAVLSQAYKEFGDFQKKYFYISNAYLCYAIGRHYNRNDRELSKKYNRAIDEIADRNYLLPSFRTVFGKVINNRYQLNEELTELKKDTIDPRENFHPPKIPEKDDYIPWLDSPLIILIGIVFLLLIVIFFLRTEKSNHN